MNGLKFFLLLLPIVAFVDAAAERAAEEPKLREPYPGEEVTGADGRKVRRWSTRGPVEVAPAPQPFDDPVQRRPPGGLLFNVDTHQLRHQQQPVYPVPHTTGDYGNQGAGHGSGKGHGTGKGYDSGKR
jgi:hypothetical protein